MRRWVTLYQDTMKLSKRHIKELIARTLKSYILEAEEEKASDDAEGGDENPFAAAGGDEGGEEDAAAEAPEGDDKKAPAKAEEPKGIPVKFNISAVKKYNDSSFLSDTGVLKSIDKRGLVVTTQPDGVDVLVNFDDISESVNRFFKQNKSKKK